MPSAGQGTLHVHRFLRPHAGVAARTVRVWLPHLQEKAPSPRLAVVYLQDGQNVLAPETAFAGVGWRAHETTQRLVETRRVRPTMLVAIDNSGAHRVDDYTPVAVDGQGGAARHYAHFLVDEVKPFVDAHYPTDPGPAATAIVGASLGGLFALWLGLQRPDVFGHAAGLSPSVWWAHGHLLRLAAGLPGRSPVRLWLDCGKREAPHQRQAVRELAELLVHKGWHRDRSVRKADLRHVEVARSRHDEAAWGARFERVLKFLMPRSGGRRRA